MKVKGRGEVAVLDNFIHGIHSFCSFIDIIYFSQAPPSAATFILSVSDMSTG